MEIKELVNVIKKLRAPDGCPWDRKQTPKSLISAFLEEAYELIEAIEEEDSEKIKEELGDVLMHIVFQSVFAEEKGRFTIDDVINDAVEKIKRRHPHVFGDVKINSMSELHETWEKIKSKERGKENRGIFDGIPKTLPALFFAYKITKKAEKVGFDWPDIANLYEKFNEELEELEEALISGKKEQIEEELGDVLFMIVNLARKLRINPEEALIKTNKKFLKRFSFIEENLKKEGKSFNEVNLEYMDMLWEKAKEKENCGKLKSEDN